MKLRHGVSTIQYWRCVNRFTLPLFSVLGIMTMLLALSNCASYEGVAPISEREQPPSRKLAKGQTATSTSGVSNHHYQVRAGDTLYSIAWRFDLDVSQLAAHNRIPPPYLIYPKQKLSLLVNEQSLPQPLAGSSTTKVASVARDKDAVVQTAAAADTQVVAPPKKLTGTQPPKPATQRNQTSQPVVKKAPVKPVASTTPPTTTPKINVAPAMKQPVAVSPVVEVKSKDIRWSKPIAAPLLKAFGKDDFSKGVFFNARSNNKVVAVADGTVVYVGDALRAYGNMVLLKHNDEYMSAYGFNKSLKVKEGDVVKQGQQISVAGHYLNQGKRLYFELRKNGKPVNPAHYMAM